MANRIFAAFLGTGNYEPCAYVYNSMEAEQTRYVQVALLNIFCKDFTEKDKIRIFVTKGAKAQHWEPTDGSDGLKKEIDALQMKADIKAVDIPDGDSEERLWEIFTKVYDEFDENASIIFDMTHAFRSLPLFGMTVINYSHYLKNTTLEGIYYGAFEAGGKKTGKAPVFNLTPAFDLMTWTSAANSFTKYGVTEELCKRIRWNKSQIESANQLSNSIKEMESTLNYMRGNQIVSGQVFDNCRKNIDKYKETEGIPALSPILDKVNEKISEFKTNEPLNFIHAVQWYIDHSMPAEALSMMKEGAITYLLKQNGQDYTDWDLRDVLGRRLGFGGKQFSYDNIAYVRKKPKNLKSGASDEEKAKYESELKKYNKRFEELKDIVENIMKSGEAKEANKIVNNINTYRNDIDHCGFDKNKSPEAFDKKIRKTFEEMTALFMPEYVPNSKNGLSGQYEEAAKQPENVGKKNSEAEIPTGDVVVYRQDVPTDSQNRENLPVKPEPPKQATGCAVFLFAAAAVGLSLFSIAMFL